MNKLSIIATEVTSLSDIMVGKKALSSKDLVDIPVTVCDVDVVNLDDSSYPVFALAEYPDNFYAGGSVLNKVVGAWIKEFGTIDDVRSYIQQNNVTMTLQASKSKQGRDYYTALFS